MEMLAKPSQGIFPLFPLLKYKREQDTQDKKRHHKRNEGILTIYITKAASFALFGVMKATSPIDGYVAFLSVEARGALHTAARTDATELE